MKSQISAMSRAAASVAPVSQIARFVVADIKGGAAAHAFRLSLVETAIMECLKGNEGNLREAIRFADGKGQRADAYRAGFAAIDGERLIAIKRDRSCKWDSAANKDVRTQADVLCAALRASFVGAWEGVMEAAKVTSQANKEAKRAQREAERAAAADAAADAAVAAAMEAAKGAMPRTVTVGLTEAVESVAAAVTLGNVERDEVEALRAALHAYDRMQAEAAVQAVLAVAPEAVSA